MRQIVLAQGNLDLHARVGIVAEHLHDLRQRFAVRGGLLDDLGDDDLAGLGITAHVRRHQDVLVDALVLGDQKPDAAILVEPADDFPVAAREHIDDRALGSAAPVDSDSTCRRPVAVQRLAHLVGCKEKVGAAVVGQEKAETVGMTLHRPGEQIQLGDDTEFALAIGHQLTITFHRREAAGEGFALGRAVDVQRRHDAVGAHRRAALTQEFENALAVGNVDVAATRWRTPQRGVGASGVCLPQFL